MKSVLKNQRNIDFQKIVFKLKKLELFYSIKKLNLILIFTIISLPNLSFAQWLELSSGTNEKLNEIFLVSSDTGFVVGNKGIVLKTTDGGINWQKLNINKSLNINDLYFLNSNIGWIVGDSGLICSTVNSGINWNCQHIDSASFVNLNSVFAFNDMEAIVGGNIQSGNGKILKTINGGVNWQNAQIESFIWSIDILKIGMKDRNNGFAITRGNVLKTNDGGANWRITDTNSVFNFEMFSILEDIAYFANNDTLYVVGWYPGYFGKSVDNAETWIHANDIDYVNLDFINSNIGYILGWGVLKKTTDGGMSFIDATSGNPNLFYDIISIDFINENIGYACGNNGKILKTENGGNTTTSLQNKRNISISFFPNPAQNEIYFNNNVNVSISDLAGKMYINKRNSNKLDVSELPNGNYIMYLDDEINQSFFVKKLMIVK